MRRIFFIIMMFVLASPTFAQVDTTLTSQRADGRLESTYAVLHRMLKRTHPEWEYHEGMNRRQFLSWQKGLRRGMAKIMKWPKSGHQPQPRIVGSTVVTDSSGVQSTGSNGFIQETWECYPMDGVVFKFLVLKPLEKTETLNPSETTKSVPALLCIPGSGATMRELTHGMALDYVRQGWIAVCVDNAAAGDQADQENRYPDSWDYDYEMSSRLLLELGWNWLGYTSFLDYQVLKWMKKQPEIDPRRIIVSGFSLGTEPMMVLGVMDRDIYAFVYNDFLCNTQERAIAMTALDKRGRRSFPNSIRHLIPGYWHEFNFPDVCCALAPRPIIFTEGGLDRDFDKVRSAYCVAGSNDSNGSIVEPKCYHYARYRDEKNRSYRDSLPEGLNMQQYLPMVNVDAGHHYFKRELIVPWLKQLLK